MAAIYIPPWPLVEVYTTTLYPVVVVDSLGFNVRISGGAMTAVPESNFNTAFSLEAGSYMQTRWFLYDGPYDDNFDTAFSMESGSYIQTRWFLYDGPYDDNFDTAFSMGSGTLINKLVIADTPDEALQFTVRIENSSTMDTI